MSFYLFTKSIAPRVQFSVYSIPRIVQSSAWIQSRHCSSNAGSNSKPPIPPSENTSQNKKTVPGGIYNRPIEGDSITSPEDEDIRKRGPLKGSDAVKLVLAYRNRSIGNPGDDRIRPEEIAAQLPDIEQRWDPTYKFGLRRSTFRLMVISLSIAIAIGLHYFLKPQKASPEIEKRNMIFFARLNASKDVTVTFSGLMYRIIHQDKDSEDLYALTTANPLKHAVKIHYEGRYMDGKVFDSSYDTNPCVFAAESLIPGLNQGISHMTRGSEFEFYIPPHLGYGEKGTKFIPPHEPLIFKVKLLDFWTDSNKWQPKQRLNFNV